MLAKGDEIFFVLPLIIVVVVLSFVWNRSRSSTIIEKWAEENELEVLHSEERSILAGPFFLRRTKGQTVYWVRVKDKTGRERTGYVRCGGFAIGLLSDKATVEWDD